MTNKIPSSNDQTNFTKYLSKIITYGLYFLVFFLPWQTRWIIKAGEIEYTTYSLCGTDILLIIILTLYIIVIPAIEPEARGKIYKLNFFKKIFLNIINVYNIVISTVHSWIAGHKPASDKKELTSRGNRMVWFFIIGLVLTSVVSVFFAFDRPLALFKLGWLILGLSLFWLIVSANYDRVKLIYALLAGVFFQAGLAIWQFLTQSSLVNKWLGLAWHNGADLGASVIETVGADGVGERWLRAYGWTDHPNILGGMTAIGALLLVGEIIKLGQFPNKFKIQNSKIIKIFSWPLLVVFSAALFFSFSRAAWLALAAGLALALGGAIRKKNILAQKNILQAVLILGLVGFILFFQFPNLVMTRIYGGERLEVKSVSERLESLKSSWPIIKNNWAAGVGLGNYTLALNRQAPGKESFYYQPAHNVFMLVWAETGILGLIFFLGLIIYLIITNLEIRNWKLEIGGSNYKNNSSFNISVLVSLIVLLALDHWLWSLRFGVLFFWLVLGIIASGNKKMISI